MKYCRMLILLSVVCLLPLQADEFEDLIQESARVSRNYNRAVAAPNTRFDKEFRSCLENMKRQSVQVQRVIRQLDLGKDFNFPLLTNELERIYLEMQSRNKSSDGLSGSRTRRSKNSTSRDRDRDRDRAPGGGKLDPHSVSPEGLLKVLTADVAALRKMGFTTEDGGSIKSSLETRRKLMEYKRLLDFFRKHYNTFLRADTQNRDVSLERFFDSRMQRMTILSTMLMETARKNNPDSLSRYNIQSETSQMLNRYHELRDNPQYRRKDGKTQHRKRTLAETTSPTALRTEIDFCIRNINAQLIQWEHSGFQSDEPIRKAGTAAPGKEDPAAVLRQPNRTDEYGSLDQKSLAALLNKRRQAVIRSNSSMDGFDHDAERMFLLSLSRDQRRIYNDCLRDFQQQGYSSGQAVRNAVLKTQTQLQMEDTMLPAAEMIRLLQAMDKEEAKRLEKNNIQFKLERGQRNPN